MIRLDHRSGTYLLVARVPWCCFECYKFVLNSKMPSAISGLNLDHLFIGYLGTYGLVLGTNVKLSSCSFRWYLRLNEC